MSGEGALRNIPHADGSRECHPVLPVRTAPAFVTVPLSLDDALARLEEAVRWMEEKRRDKIKGDHELEVAIRQHARALDDVRRAI